MPSQTSHDLVSLDVDETELKQSVLVCYAVHNYGSLHCDHAVRCEAGDSL